MQASASRKRFCYGNLLILALSCGLCVHCLPISLDSLDDLRAPTAGRNSLDPLDGSAGAPQDTAGAGGNVSSAGAAGDLGDGGQAGTPGNGQGNAGASQNDAGAAGTVGSAGSSGQDPSCTLTHSVIDVGDTPVAGGEGGSLFQDHCPEGDVIIGMLGYTRDSGTFVDRVQAVCGRISFDKQTCALSITKSQTLPMHGVTGTELFQRLCPTNSIVTGISGRSSQYFDALTVHCTEFTLESSSGKYTLSPGITTVLTQVGTAGEPFGPYLCPQGQVAAGTHGRSGDWLDAYGLTCARLQIQ